MENKREVTIVTNNIEAINNTIAEQSIQDLYTNQLSNHTKINYISTIKHFFGVEDINDITLATITSVTTNTANAYAHILLEQGLGKSTINNKLSALHSFYKFLCRRSIGVMQYNPFSVDEGCIRFKNTTKVYSAQRTLTRNEIHKLYNSVEITKTSGTSKIIAYRDLIILQILTTGGLRREELCKISIGDIKLNQGRYVIEIVGKGDKSRFVVLASTIKGNVDKYLKLRGVTYQDKELPLITSHSSNSNPNTFVGVSTIYRVVKKYANKAELDADSISPHTMRHTFATIAHKDLGVNKDNLQELLGHSSSATTQRYIHASNMIDGSPAEALADLFTQ